MSRLTEAAWNASPEELIAMSRRLNNASALRDATIGGRDESPDAFKAWEEAAREWREARDAMFGPGFDKTPDPHLAAIRTGEPAAVETAIRFLETDPVCFHAGYAKERLLRALKAVRLSATQKSRLRNAMIHSLIEGERKEQEAWCRLAPSLDIERLRGALRVLVDDAGDVGRRAAWCLWRIDEYVQVREGLARSSHSDPR